MSSNFHTGNIPAQWSFLPQFAVQAGAVAVGVAPSAPIAEDHWDIFSTWVQSPNAGELHYMKNHPIERQNPGSEKLLKGTTAIISAAFSYANGIMTDGIWPYIACHARGRDYHKTVKKHLEALAISVKNHFPDAITRVFVDSAPILERTIAQYACIGTIGKNGMLIVPNVGCRVLLGEIFVANVPSVDPPAPGPIAPFSLCKNCSQCIQACPTGALTEHGIVNCTKCLSYFTIEKWSVPPDSQVWEEMNLIFGCDRCTASCPQNRAAKTILEPATTHTLPSTLEELTRMSEIALKEALAGTCLSRTGAVKIKKQAEYVIQYLENQRKKLS